MSDAPVLILAGGLGTRLRPLTETLPKVLAPALGRPFIDHLMADMARQGIRRFVLSVGYLAEQIEAHLGDGAALGNEVRYVREREPLGTGGAVAAALPALEPTFILANGDTLLEVDLAALLARHRAAPDCPVTMAAAWVEDRGRYGALSVQGGRVTGFREKSPGAGPGWINGGVMAVDAALLDGAPEPPFSMEADWLPRFAAQERIALHESPGFFVDMGTHETLATLDEALAGYLASTRPA